ncbi:MAG: VCBS repeat-containing protein [Anaerolineae bacterium]|nr:VCBS repeat-containing protein [Anaerolineae bacterium]
MSRIFTLLIIATALLSLLLVPEVLARANPQSGPGSDEWPRPSLVPDNPTIDPVSNTHTAPPTTTVSITYDEPINPATVSTRTFAVHAMQTGLLPQTYNVNGGTITLTPPQPFKPGDLVQVSATTGTLNLSGQGPISPTVWQFRTAPSGGYGHFAVSTQTFPLSDTTAVALGDVNGDGAVDALVVNWFDEANTIWLNDGSGHFSRQPEPLGNAAGLAAELGDLDGDGDLDAVIADEFIARNEIWLNNGAGLFTQSSQIMSATDTISLALGDVDGDGDLDIFNGRYPSFGNGSNLLWLNDGHGVFTDSRQTLGNSSTYGVSLGDLDGDRDLDVFAANGGPFVDQPNQIWLNDGTGIFTNPYPGLGNASSTGVALGDLNDDGYLDAFVINGGTQPNEVWFNSGDGHFTDSGQRLGNSFSWDVDLGDLDGDGDLDAFVGNTDLDLTGAVAANNIWLNDGHGNFSGTDQRLGQASSIAVPLSDLDGDGDLDAFVGNLDPNVVSDEGQGAPNEVWFNTQPVYYFPLIFKNGSG